MLLIRTPFLRSTAIPFHLKPTGRALEEQGQAFALSIGRGKRARYPTIECEEEEREGFYRLPCVARDVAPPLPVNIVLDKAG